MSEETLKPVDPRSFLNEIVADSAVNTVHRIRAARSLLAAEPKRPKPPEPAPDEDPVNLRAIQFLGAGTMPAIGHHRGVRLHDFQHEARIAAVVRPEIDEALATADHETLFAMAANVHRSPESRLFAAAKYRALHEQKSAAHERRGGGELTLLDAHTAGLSSMNWADAACYGSLLCTGIAPGEKRPPTRPPDQAARVRAAQGKTRPLSVRQDDR